MAKRTYDQYCPGARALDLVGERWTLLIVRELIFFGPKRFTDLLAGLPGVAPNVLSGRLKEMEGAGLIGRTKLRPPAGSTVYELTEFGEGLRPMMMELYRRGPQLLGPPTDTDHLRLSWALGAM